MRRQQCLFQMKCEVGCMCFSWFLNEIKSMGRKILNIEESSPSQSKIYGSLIYPKLKVEVCFPPLFKLVLFLFFGFFRGGGGAGGGGGDEQIPFAGIYYFGGAGLIGVDEDEMC